ncbi:hypothetical protein KY312_03680 [Candidatus Woesearchaeota archaeon]|nr:hypothetical protein [Candidatus Woesearchaeota archaeon]
MDFENNKKTFLSKLDKSKKGSIDNHIIGLIKKINNLNNYYSTSSCSGRIVLLKESESGRKDEAEWIFVSHGKADFEKINKIISQLADKTKTWFKFEPPIIHISCRNIENAQKMLDIARPLFKLTGIISTSKNIIEVRGTDRIDTPIGHISEEQLKHLTEIANQKLEKNWEKLHEFEKEFGRL